MACPKHLVTEDGYDMQFGTNVIGTPFYQRDIYAPALIVLLSGPFLFTELLMPLLVEATKTSRDHHARVVMTASGGAYLSTLHWGTFKDGPVRQRTFFGHLYNQSKLVSSPSFWSLSIGRVLIHLLPRLT